MTELRKYILTGKCNNLGKMLHDVLIEAKTIELRMKSNPGKSITGELMEESEWQQAGESLSIYICSMDAVDKFGICEEEHDELWLNNQPSCIGFTQEQIDRFKRFNRFLLEQIQMTTTDFLIKNRISL